MKSAESRAGRPPSNLGSQPQTRFSNQHSHGWKFPRSLPPDRVSIESLIHFGYLESYVKPQCCTTHLLGYFSWLTPSI